MPNAAVARKFALVFSTATRVVDVARVRARVKRNHIVALERRFSEKKNYWAA